jgi:ATP-dependent Clp protease protease subunit
MVDLPSSEPQRRLFERRTVLVGGPLEGPAVTRLSAELMALDGRSGDDVELVVNSPGGPLGDIAAVLDVMDLMRGLVNATCTGQAAGTAGVLLACATGRRRAGRHARISLRLPEVEARPGNVAEIDRQLAEVAAARAQLVEALVAATGQPRERIEAELDHGAVHDAEAARRLGLIDEVADSPRRSPRSG